MNLTRWNDPFTGLTSLHSQLDDMFNSFFGSMPASTAQNVPAMDVYTEDEKSLVAEVQTPGFTKDDVEVSVHNGVLEIKGEKHQKEEDKGKDKKRSYMVRESHASFYRSIALPKYADADGVTADFNDGVLKVTVPFKELPAPKRITISAGSKKK
jgi:HSP20 family protein